MGRIQYICIDGINNVSLKAIVLRPFTLVFQFPT